MNSHLKRLSLVAATFFVTAVLFSPTVLHGDEFNLKTYITLNQPFQVPGAVLEPNVKYVLRRLGAGPGTNDVVRILNADETQVISTFFGIPDYRQEPTDHTVLTFYETSRGYPKTVQSWFYPGRLIGLEFVYPKEKKAEIMAHVSRNEAVRVAQNAEPENFIQQPNGEPAPTAPSKIAQNTQPEVQREKPAEPATSAAEPITAPGQQTAPTAKAKANAGKTAPVKELPRTAGEMPLIGLLGGASLGLRMLLKRV
jgi:hypothetical protein